MVCLVSPLFRFPQVDFQPCEKVGQSSCDWARQFSHKPVLDKKVSRSRKLIASTTASPNQPHSPLSLRTLTPVRWLQKGHRRKAFRQVTVMPLVSRWETPTAPLHTQQLKTRLKLLPTKMEVCDLHQVPESWKSADLVSRSSNPFDPLLC